MSHYKDQIYKSQSNDVKEFLCESLNEVEKLLIN